MKVKGRKLVAAQSKMKRSMLEVNWDDMKTNEWIRGQTTVEDIFHSFSPHFIHFHGQDIQELRKEQ